MYLTYCISNVMMRSRLADSHCNKNSIWLVVNYWQCEKKDFDLASVVEKMFSLTNATDSKLGLTRFMTDRFQM